MPFRRLMRCLIPLLGILCATTAFADSWLPATTKQYLSADGNWRLTVEPRPLTSPLAYFSDAVDGKKAPGGIPGDSRTSAVGTMEQRSGGHWNIVWQQPLRNDVAPVDAVALPGGAAMTLDNWHSMGFGDDAVVLYDAQGRQAAHFALTDFLPGFYVRALPHSVSSLHWRGDPQALPDGRQVSIPVVIPSQDQYEVDDEGAIRHFGVLFDVTQGKLIPPSGPEWERVLHAVREVRAQQRIAESAEWQSFVEPLAQPTSGSVRDWHLYLYEAFLRLDPDWQDDVPATGVLDSPGTAGYSASNVGNLLRDIDGSGSIMLASPSPRALLELLDREAQGLGDDSLHGRRIYLALDTVAFIRATLALQRTGAQLIQLDPAHPIPQRPERLNRFQEDNPARE